MSPDQKRLLSLVKLAAARYKACASDAESRGLSAYAAGNEDPEAACAQRYQTYFRAKKTYEAKYGPVPVTGRGEKVLRTLDVRAPVGERQVISRRNPEEVDGAGMSTNQKILLGAGIAAVAYYLYGRQASSF